MLTTDQCAELILNEFKQLQEQHRKQANENLNRIIKGEKYTMAKKSESNIDIVLHCVQPENHSKFFHNHDYFEMIYVYRGSFENCMLNNQFTLRQGDIMLLNPNVMHSVFRRSTDDLVFNIMISKKLFQDYLAKILEDNKMFSYFFSDYLYHNTKMERYLYFQDSDDPKVKETIESMIQEFFSKEANYDSMMLSCLIALFARLSRNYQKENKLAVYENDSNRMIYQMMAYINQHFSDVTLNQLAEHFQYSPGHLSKILRKSGKSFSQLLLECRLDKAAYYLKHTDLPISQIIEKIGYQNRVHFYRLFKETFHETPTSYRKNTLTG